MWCANLTDCVGEHDCLLTLFHICLCEVMSKGERLMQKNQIRFYKTLVDFLSEVLGSNTEVIFHLRDKKGFYIESIKNGHISGRTVSSPITGLALEMIKNESYKNRDYLVNYRGISKKGEFLRSSTFFIKDSSGYLKGLICINTDVSTFINVKHILDELSSFRLIHEDPIEAEQSKPYTLKLSEDSPHTGLDSDSNQVEYFSQSIEEIIFTIIPEENLKRNNLSPSDRIEIVKTLNDRGIFSMKGAVSSVADILQVSIPTIYRYIKEIKG